MPGRAAGAAARRTASSRRRRRSRRPRPAARERSRARARRRAGIVAPHSDVIRSSCLTFVIGMIPGTIGTSMPMSRARRDEVEVQRVVEEQLRDQELRARVDLLLEVVEVVLGARGVDVRLGEARRADREGVVARGSARRARASTRGRPRSSPTRPAPAGGSPRRARTLSIPASRIASSVSRSSSTVEPTQVKCAIASRPYSSLMRETISIVLSRGASRPRRRSPTRSRAAASAARSTRRTGCARPPRSSAGRTRTRTRAGPAGRAARRCASPQG